MIRYSAGMNSPVDVFRGKYTPDQQAGAVNQALGSVEQVPHGVRDAIQTIRFFGKIYHLAELGSVIPPRNMRYKAQAMKPRLESRTVLVTSRVRAHS